VLYDIRDLRHGHTVRRHALQISAAEEEKEGRDLVERFRAVNRGRGTPRPPRQTSRPGNETPWVDGRLSPTTASFFKDDNNTDEKWTEAELEEAYHTTSGADSPDDLGDGRATHQPALATSPAAASSLPSSGAPWPRLPPVSPCQPTPPAETCRRLLP